MHLQVRVAMDQRTNEMEYVERGEMLVDPAHESLHEDDLWQTDRQAAEVAWKGVEVAVVMQLHGTGEVQRQVTQVRTPTNAKPHTIKQWKIREWVSGLVGG